MKTTFDIVDILYTHIKNSSLKTLITGDVWKSKRPAGSNKEDVVINALPSPNTDGLQHIVANVNIYVPNKAISLNGVQDNGLPDSARLKTLAREAVTVLTDKWAEDYNFDVQQQDVFEDDQSAAHYVNIRLDFHNINVSN